MIRKVKYKIPAALAVFICIFSSPESVYSQVPDFSKIIRYSYDDAGNRVKRELLQVTPVLEGDEGPEAGKWSGEAGESITEKTDSAGHSKITVFPNPVKYDLTVQIENFDSGSPSRLLITDLGGRVIHEQIISGDRVNLDFSNYSTGPYALNIFTRNKWSAWKVIKQ